jgi:hypothetical protein
MKMRPEDGTFEVAAGSRVLIVSEAENVGQNLTAYPNNVACTTGNSPVVVTDTGLKRTGTLTVSAKVGQVCALDLSFNFVPDAKGSFPDGAQYRVTLIEQRSNGSTDTFDDPVPVEPPPLVRRGYTFKTV